MDSLNLYDMRFKPGQRVVCTRKGNHNWSGRDNNGVPFSSVGPAFNEEVTVKESGTTHENCIVLWEYLITPPGHTMPQCFSEKHFAPLADITEIHELLSAVPQTERA